MDRNELSDAIIQEWGVVFTQELEMIATEVMREDCAGIERRLQEVLRRIGGRMLTDVLRVRASQRDDGERCPTCGGRLRLVDGARKRELHGLVGDATVRRATYVCRFCQRGHAPFDVEMGLGTGRLSPGLARVAVRAGIEDSFADAADLLTETLGVHVPADAIRRVSEAMGAVAEAEQQEAMDQTEHGTPLAVGTGVETLVVEVDGVHVPLEDAWHEMKVGRAAPLGPATSIDARSGRTTLRLGSSTCQAGLEGAERFWYRAYLCAVQAGLGPLTRRVVVLGDGAEWIWGRAAAFLGDPAREVIEIVDIFHAYEHLWAVGHAVYPDAELCTRWVEPLKDALYDRGAAAVLDALDALPSLSPDAAESVRTTRAYFAGHAARMDYPRFVAQHLPIGSGAIESLCKNLVAERAKGAGMRWTASGVQSIITLRALHRSGDWVAFWARHPLAEHHRRWPPLRPRRSQHATPPVSSPPAPPPQPVPPPSLHSSAPHPWRRGPAIVPRCA